MQQGISIGKLYYDKNGNLDVYLKKEDNPWLQWHLKEKVSVKELSISNRKDSYGNRLRQVELRAGVNGIHHSFRGRITTNELCGKFDGPGENGKEYIIKCKSPIVADYVTVQIVDKNSFLQLNEIYIINRGMTLLFV